MNEAMTREAVIEAMAERARVVAEEIMTIAENAPDGAVLAAAEEALFARAPELLREFLRETLQHQIRQTEKKGRRAANARATNARAINPVLPKESGPKPRSAPSAR